MTIGYQIVIIIFSDMSSYFEESLPGQSYFGQIVSFVYQTHNPSLYLIQSVGVCMGGGGNSEKLHTKLTEVVTSGERKRRPGLGIKDFNLIGNNFF